jgi:hypothetical protein
MHRLIHTSVKNFRGLSTTMAAEKCSPLVPADLQSAGFNAPQRTGDNRNHGW